MAAFVKVVIVLVLVALLVARRLDMGAVLLIAAGAMMTLFWTAPRVFFDQLTAPGSGFFSGTGKLMVLIIFINTFGHLLSLKPEGANGRDGRTGIRRLIDAAGTILRDPRAVVAATPSIIGLLPMPGGALLSAPMVEEISSGLEISPEKKTAVNFWYRHIYEYLFPIYPGIWVMAEVLGVSAVTVIAFNWPLTFISAAAGLVIVAGMRRKPGFVPPPFGARELARAVGDVLLNLWPVLAVVGIFVVVWSMGYKATWVVTAGLPVVVIAFGLIRCRSVRKVPGFIVRGADPKFLLLVIAAMIFKEVVEATGAVTDVSRFLRSTPIPPVALCIILPYIAGFLTGITVAFIGISVPLLTDFIGTGPDLNAGLAMVTFASGFMGVMTSPAHLCLVLSRDYYGADLGRTYKYILIPAALVIAAALALHSGFSAAPPRRTRGASRKVHSACRLSRPASPQPGGVALDGLWSR